MKKIICLIVLLFATLPIFAYSYPAGFFELLKQFEEDVQKIEILIDEIYEGWIIVAQFDYCVFKLENDDVIIIPYSAIKEISLL